MSNVQHSGDGAAGVRGEAPGYDTGFLRVPAQRGEVGGDQGELQGRQLQAAQCGRELHIQDHPAGRTVRTENTVSTSCLFCDVFLPIKVFL